MSDSATVTKSTKGTADQKGKFRRNPSPVARCKIAAGGNAYAGEMLYQLGYRFARGEALCPRHGKLWCAQTGKNWQAELALTVEQYKTAVRILKAKGLVEHRLEKFSEYQLFQITWLRLSKTGQAFFDDMANGKQLAWMTPGHGGNDASLLAASTPGYGVNGPYKGKNTAGKKLKGNKTQSLAGGEMEIFKEKEQEEHPGKNEKKQGKYPSIKQIEAFWLDAHAKHRPDLSVSAFIGPDWNNGEIIAIKLGDQAAAVIDAVVKNWTEFVLYVRAQTSHQVWPQRPTLAFMAIHGTLGLDFIKLPPPSKTDGLIGGSPAMPDEF